MLMNAAHAHEQHERHIISEAERLAKEEGFTHVRSKSMSRTGFKGVHMRVDKFAAVLKCAGTNELLGITATAEEAALLYARRLKGQDTHTRHRTYVRLLALALRRRGRARCLSHACCSLQGHALASRQEVVRERLDVGSAFVKRVLKRFRETGDVAT